MAATTGERTGPLGPVVFGATAFMLAFAPLIRGGNRPIPLAILETAALIVLATIALSPDGVLRRVPALLLWGFGILALYPLLQLVPIPGGLWAALPGHEPYAHVLQVAGIDAGAWRALSIHPAATEYSWLVLTPCAAVFLAAHRLERRDLRRLVVLFVIVAFAEAVLGILQAGAGPDSLLTLGNRFGGGAATGTYINKNHFAALMAMALPVMLSRWAIAILPTRDEHGEVVHPHPRSRDATFALRIMLSFAIVLGLLALLLTRSRAGIGCGLAAFALASLMLVWYAGTVVTRATLAIVAAFALACAAYAGFTPIVERFSPETVTLGMEGRLRIASATVQAGLDFLPFGSGLGTFADVFRRYQVERLTGFVDHAHNDYAEVFLEIGVAGLVAMALMLAAYVLRWRELLRERITRGFAYTRIGAGLGMLALIGHGLFDFNFHIPANAIAFSFLAGVFFSRSVKPTQGAGRA